jgi:hypothetical protein
MTGRVITPSDSSISGRVCFTPPFMVRSSVSPRHAGSPARCVPRTDAVSSPVNVSAAGLNMVTCPLPLTATTPLSTVETIFSRYSLASTTCPYS